MYRHATPGFCKYMYRHAPPDLNTVNACTLLKGIVSRDFEGLQMILMNRSWVPDVPLVVCYFLNFRFHIVL